MTDKRVTAILFDLDGTLIDTNELIIASYLHTLDHYCPGQFKREDVLPFIGPPLYETFSGINAEKCDDMISMYRAFNHEKHDELVTEYETVYETLDELKSGLSARYCHHKAEGYSQYGIEADRHRGVFRYCRHA